MYPHLLVRGRWRFCGAISGFYLRLTRLTLRNPQRGRLEGRGCGAACACCPWLETRRGGIGTAQGAGPANAHRKQKSPGSRPGFVFVASLIAADQKSMPPPPGIAGAGVCFFGTSATIASVVMSRPATEAAFCSAARTTLVGSMMPLDIKFTYSPDCAS